MTVTESKQTSPSAPPDFNTPHSGTNQPHVPSQTNPPWSNPYLGVNQPNTPSQVPSWNHPSHISNQPTSKTYPATSIGFKDHVYPSHIPPIHQQNSIPMGNPYSVQPPVNTHSASGSTYYPQQPQMFGQPAMQPFVPGQTMLIMQQQDSGGGLGDMVKEALVHSVINAGVNRIINPHNTHYVESKPSGSSDSSPTSSTHITYNNYYSNTPSDANSAAGTSVPQGTITEPASGSGSVNHHHYTHRHTHSNSTATNQTNSSDRPSIVNNLSHKISDNEIFKITELLFAMSTNVSKYIKLNLQKRSTSVNVTDEAPKPLFNIDPILFDYPTIYVTHTLYGNYEHDFQKKTNRTQETREHENLLLDTYLNTNVMAATMQWLSDRGFIGSDDFERKDVLHRIWFTIFSGSTCGFERIFDSENYGTEILGVQDWLHFSNRESLNHINYMGYVDQMKLGTSASLLKLNFEMNGIKKPNATIFVGTMPELEMALYTICFYARSNDACTVSLGGTIVNLYTHSFLYFGNLVIDLAFPMMT